MRISIKAEGPVNSEVHIETVAFDERGWRRVAISYMDSFRILDVSQLGIESDFSGLSIV
jgi:hypothetical protein